jgi:hypothetical protein
MSGLQNTGQNLNIKRITNRSFENVAELKYLGTPAENNNLVLEEIRNGLNSGNAFYHSVRNILYSRLLSKNVKIRTQKI